MYFRSFSDNIFSWLCTWKKTATTEKRVSSRNIKAIDTEKINIDIKVRPTQQEVVKGIDADIFNETLSTTLDQHALMRIRTMRDRKSASWVTNTVWQAKEQRRTAERKMAQNQIISE